MNADIAMIGLAVMGENLALNMESRGYTVAAFNRTTEKVDELVNGRAKGKNIIGTHSLEELVGMLKTPRKIMLMVKAGSPVDEVINQLIPMLEKGDIIIDGGNSHFTDTMRRTKTLEERGLRFIGTGVSGGEEGALHGPSLMPGGSASAWEEVKPIFQAISAKVGPNNDIPCCDWVGTDGAGHYVKMIHNAIEYADMQLIAESYNVLKDLLGLTPPELHDVFSQWNTGQMNSYLIEITADIFTKKDDDTGDYLVNKILDTAQQKGTGKWASQNALDLGVPVPTMIEAVTARMLSALKLERVNASALLPTVAKTFSQDREQFISAVHDALYASKMMCYAQGFQLLREAAKEYHWSLNYGRIAMLWRGGCIIRAQFLEEIKKAYDQNPELTNLMLASYFVSAITAAQGNWRLVVSEAVKNGIPVPAFSSALAYFDGYRSAQLPANLTQAQRDYFGAHTYERNDKTGVFHTEWTSKS